MDKSSASFAVESGYQPVCLEITGPPEAGMFIADLFGVGVNESLP
jgi:hypothetical protein